MKKHFKLVTRLITILLLVACSKLDERWSLLANGDYFPIRYDRYSYGLWALNQDTRDLTFFQETQTGFSTVRKIQTPFPEFEIIDFCISPSDVWINFAGPHYASYLGVWKLDKKGFVWEQVNSKEMEDVSFCKSLPDGSIYFFLYNSTDLIQVKDNDITRVRLDVEGVPNDLVIDADDHLWLLTSKDDGTIYKQAEGEHWKLWKTYRSVKLYFVNQDTLWLASGRPYDVSEWNVQIPEQPLKTYKPPAVNPLQAIFQDKNNVVWIISDEKMWKRLDDSTELQEIIMPEGVNSVTVDQDSNRIFVSTYTGIYYFNTVATR